ncbi:hypothetical protein OLEAN_C34970 [Oleispira antarctica RB-8]|uniref:Uncharacterized protein n=1 Tax=Oleispira antarctica RB-8 TaxID=698738 RepID=R4YU87_OLEAN|nr:hypothetical protein OLEAN_C34970 [Oleispira antarctica RB-8]
MTTQNLNGSTVEVEVKGTSFGHAHGDVGLKIIDNTGNAKTVLDKYNIPMDAMQLAFTKIRERFHCLILLPQLESLNRIVCRLIL